MGSAVEVSGRKTVEQGIANLGVDGASSEQEDDDSSSGSPESSCMTSSLTEAEAHSCFEKLRAYLYTNGRNGGFSETLHLLSKSVNSFTHETQEKRRAKSGEGDAGNSSRCVAGVVVLTLLLWCRAEQP